MNYTNILRGDPLVPTAQPTQVVDNTNTMQEPQVPVINPERDTLQDPNQVNLIEVALQHQKAIPTQQQPTAGVEPSPNNMLGNNPVGVAPVNDGNINSRQDASPASLEEVATPNVNVNPAPAVPKYKVNTSDISYKNINVNKVNPITGKKGGSISWRNNNPGNLKFEFSGIVGVKHPVKRSYESALRKARKLYGNGVVALDRYGYLVFDSMQSGKRGMQRLLVRRHKNRTIPQMLPHYAIKDYVGTPNHKAYASSIYKYGDKHGVNLRGKKIKDMSPKEVDIMLDAMRQFEGFKKGS